MPTTQWGIRSHRRHAGSILWLGELQIRCLNHAGPEGSRRFFLGLPCHGLFQHPWSQQPKTWHQSAAKTVSKPSSYQGRVQNFSLWGNCHAILVWVAQTIQLFPRQSQSVRWQAYWMQQLGSLQSCLWLLWPCPKTNGTLDDQSLPETTTTYHYDPPCTTLFSSSFGTSQLHLFGGCWNPYLLQFPQNITFTFLAKWSLPKVCLPTDARHHWKTEDEREPSHLNDSTFSFVGGWATCKFTISVSRVLLKSWLHCFKMARQEGIIIYWKYWTFFWLVIISLTFIYNFGTWHNCKLPTTILHVVC